MKKLLLFIFFGIVNAGFAKTTGDYPKAIEHVLDKSGKNRSELEKAITYFKKEKDLLKLKAIYFLIANMDIHYSSDYYWIDGHGKKVEYNELAYSDFGKAVSGFEEIKKKTPGLKPIPIKLPDIAFIKADLLIDDVENAFKAWKSSYSKNIPFNDFCEYILPYRVAVEPLQNWRSIYQKRFNWISAMAAKKDLNEALNYTASDERNWFTDTWGKETRTEPLPRLGALQLLLRKKGPCEDIADLEIFTLRSQGIPVALDVVPHWATTNDGHSFNTVFDGKMQAIDYDAMITPPLNNSLGREPSKVIRITYSKQPNVLADFEDAKNIPSSFMQTKNYKDVTDLYWKTTTLNCHLFPINGQPKIAYACIFNGMRWIPAWWGKVNNNAVSFSSMSKGVVYLPTFYIGERIQVAGYPVAEGYNHEITLQPDLNHKTTMVIQEEDKYLIFQQGKKYRLYYWDNVWHLCGTKTPIPFSKTMFFDNVPKSALLLLVPEYSQGKERPFIMTEDGKRVWM